MEGGISKLIKKPGTSLHLVKADILTLSYIDTINYKNRQSLLCQYRQIELGYMSADFSELFDLKTAVFVRFPF